MIYVADSVVLSVHAQPSFPLPAPAVPGHKLSPDARVISQSPHSKTEVLGNSHPPRSHPQPMVGALVDKPPTPSPYRWGNLEVCVYTGSQKASSGNLIEHTFPAASSFCLTPSTLPQISPNYFCRYPCLRVSFWGHQDQHLQHGRHYSRPHDYLHLWMGKLRHRGSGLPT